MRFVRRLAALVVRGPDRQFVRQDLEDMYARDRAQRVSFVRASWRYGRRLAASAVMVWRDDAANGAEWLVEARRGTTLQDLRFATRLFRKHPAPVSIAVGGLALSIGVVVSVFSIVDATMLRPYAIDDPSSVVSVGSPGHGNRAWPYWRYSTFLKMKEGATLSRVEASDSGRALFDTRPTSTSSSSRGVTFVSGGYLQMLGGRPSRGRTLEPSDDAPGAPPVAVISHRFWSAEFNSDPAAIGKTIWLNNAPFTVVGVLQPGFAGFTSNPAPIWAPLAARDEVLGGSALGPASTDEVHVIARLAPGAGMMAAQENLSAIAMLARGGAPHTGQSAVRLSSAASPFDQLGTEEYVVAGIVFTIVALVLAVACANTANLLLAAATTRMQEMGIRLAMGADTRRLVRQLINESLLLGLISGGLGLMFSWWFVPLLVSTLDFPPELNIAPDGRLVWFTVAVSLLTGFGVGLSPARHGVRGDLLHALKSQSGASGPARSRLRTSFVGFQAAVSMLLLVVATLLARTAINISRVEIGFDADRILTVNPERQPKGFDEAGYFRMAVEALRVLPGVERVAMAEHLPWNNRNWTEEFTFEGTSYEILTFHSDSELLATLGVRLQRGRAFRADEADREAPVALISESVARAFFPDTDPIGMSTSKIPWPAKDAPAAIIGVVGDAMLGRNDALVTGAIFRPIRKTRSNPAVIAVRTANPGMMTRPVLEALRRVNPQVNVSTRPMREGLDSFVGSRRVMASLAAPLAILTVLLAGLGVFGVTAFVVAQRAQEVSLRLAIGASTGQILQMLVKDSLRPVMVGSIVGLVLALVFSRVTASELLGGVSPHDPLSIAIAVVILVVSALVAVVIPSRRVARSNPATLLRQV